MSKTKGVVKLVVNTDTDPTPQEPILVENETSGIFVHSTNSSVASRLWFSQGTSLSSSFSKLEFDTDIGLKIHTENPVNVVHDASIRFGTRGSERWKIEGLNGSSGDLLPAINNSLKIGRSGFNLNSIFSRQLISDDTLALAASGATKWNIDSNGHFTPTSTAQNIGNSASYLSFIYGNQLLAGTGQALYLGSNAGTYKWYIANSTNAALVPNTAGAFDIGTSSSRVGTAYTTNLNNSGSLTTGTIDASSGIITDSIQTRTTTSSLAIKTGTGYPTRITIDSSGNVGVGVTSPSEKLQVNSGNAYLNSGNVLVNRANAEGAGTFGGVHLMVDGSVQSKLTTPTSGTLAIDTNGSERIRIDSTGNVGIGTTTPAVLLDLASSSPQIRLSRPSVPSGTVDVRIATSNDSGIFGTTSSHSIVFRTNNTERVYILQNGRVGINTLSPTEQLQVQGNFRTTVGSAGDLSITHTNVGGNLISNILSASSVSLSLGADGSEAIRIDTSNRVGIGTSTPSYKLDILGNLRISDNQNNLTTKVGRYYGSPYTNTDGDWLAIDIRGVNGANELNFGGGSVTANTATRIGFITGATTTTTTGTERMCITSAGNVGIGISSPTYKLQVVGNTDASFGMFIDNSNTGTSTKSELRMRAGASGAAQGAIRMNVVGSTLGEALELYNSVGPVVFTPGGVERVRITGTGNVGIGSSTPDAKLVVNGGVKSTGLFASGYGLSPSAAQGAYVLWNVDGGSGRTHFVNNRGGSGAAGGGFCFSNDHATPTSDIFRIGFDGTLATTTGIEINSLGTGDRNAFIDFWAADTPGDYNARIIRNSGVNGDFAIQNLGSGFISLTGGTIALNSFQITNQTIYRYGEIRLLNGLPNEINPAGEGVFISNQGNFAPINNGVCNLGGTSNRWVDVYANTYYGYSAGNTTDYGAFINASDLRLKENIEKIQNAQSVIMQLNPVKFHWKDNNKELKDSGFIAQEVYAVIPEGVRTGDDAPEVNETWFLSMNHIIPYLTKALQEALEEINQLKKELLELKNK